MCLICSKPDFFDFQHMEEEVKKLSQQERLAVAKRLKDSVRTYEIWTVDERSSGFEMQSLRATLKYLKTAQHLLSRYM